MSRTITGTPPLAGRLGSACTEWRELDPARDADLAVDGFLPPLWCEPDTAEELGAVLRLANEVGASVIPRGGGTRMGVGRPPRSADLLLSTRRLNQIVQYEPSDLTITVGAGLLLGDLQREVGKNGQLLALDPPAAERATIGGVVASNASGPLRLRYGSARDLVIGTRVANADGALTKAGGTVVKNVAGYDLNKLYAGAFGTLGVIVELSFKLHPLPRRQATVLAGFDDLSAVDAALRRLKRTPLGPLALEVLNGRATAALGIDWPVPPREWLLVVLVGGYQAAVGRLSEQIARYCRECGGATERLADDEHEGLWQALRELPDASVPNRPVLKLAVPPARSVAALDKLRELLDRFEPHAALDARAGIGLLYATFLPRQWGHDDLGRLAAIVAEGRAYAAAQRGSLVVESCPLELKQQVDVWGASNASHDLMRSIKRQLDPRGTLNPDRFVGDI